MSLLDLNFEPFNILTAVQTDDNQGGRRNAWTAGEEFYGVAVSALSAHSNAKDQTAKHAQAPAADPEYTLLTKRSTLLPFHAVVRRAGDGMIFRITSDANDAKTPKGSLLDLRMHAAEKWRLPDGGSLSETEANNDES